MQPPPDSDTTDHDPLTDGAADTDAEVLIPGLGREAFERQQREMRERAAADEVLEVRDGSEATRARVRVHDRYSRHRARRRGVCMLFAVLGVLTVVGVSVASLAVTLTEGGTRRLVPRLTPEQTASGATFELRAENETVYWALADP